MSPLALVTGATGFIGARVVTDLLQAGYNVRLTVRREDQVETLSKFFSSYVERIQFLVVPDITLTGAFDEAVKDVKYVLHVASPLPGTGKDLLTPAVRGTISILESALKTSSIKKVVVTASVASFLPLGELPDSMTLTETTDVNVTLSPEEIAALEPMAQYQISKMASYKATIDFVHDQKPAFDVITLHPVFVFGRNPLQGRADQLAGSNGTLYKSLMSETPILAQFLGVHIDDVAEAHVKALDESITGFRSYLLSAPRRSWVDVDRFIRAQYPDVDFKLKPVDQANYTVDVSKAESELGMRFKPMEEQVKDVVDQQLELRR